MEIVLQILSIALVLVAFIGALAMIGIIAGIILVVNGGEIRIGYEEDNNLNFKDNAED